MVTKKQIERWAKQVRLAWRKRMRGAQRLFGEAQQRAFLAEEVMSLMRAIYEEAGDRVLLGDMVAVYDASARRARLRRSLKGGLHATQVTQANHWRAAPLSILR